MRLNEFVGRPLTEFSGKAMIEENCSEIVSIYKATGKVLFRGVLHSSRNIHVAHSPFNRSPRHTGLITSTTIDDKLQQAGFTAVRSNSIFCTSNLIFAENFGDLFVIFPFNGFKFTYSKYADLTTDLEAPGWSLNGAYNLDMDDDSYIASLLNHQTVEDFISVHGFNQTDLVPALESGVEVYVHGKYLAAPTNILGMNLIESVLGFRPTRPERG